MSEIVQIRYAIEDTIEENGYTFTKNDPNKGLNPTMFTMTGTEDAFKEKGIRDKYTVCIEKGRIYLVITRHDIPAGNVVNHANEFVRKAERTRLFTITMTGYPSFMEEYFQELQGVMEGKNMGRFFAEMTVSSRKIEVVVREEYFVFVVGLVEAFFDALLPFAASDTE